MNCYHEQTEDGRTVRVQYDCAIRFDRDEISPRLIASELLALGASGLAELKLADAFTLLLRIGDRRVKFGGWALRLSIDEFSNEVLRPLLDLPIEVSPC